MGLFSRLKKNKPQKNKRESWHETPCQDFAYNFVMRYESFFDVIDTGYNENKEILFEEMVDITSVWLERCPEDANAVFAAIILIGNNPECENMLTINNQTALDRSYQYACSMPAAVEERKNWFYTHATFTFASGYVFEEYVEKMPKGRKAWFEENKRFFFSKLIKLIS